MFNDKAVNEKMPRSIIAVSHPNAVSRIGAREVLGDNAVFVVRRSRISRPPSTSTGHDGGCCHGTMDGTGKVAG